MSSNRNDEISLGSLTSLLLAPIVVVWVLAHLVNDYFPSVFVAPTEKEQPFTLAANTSEVTELRPQRESNLSEHQLHGKRVLLQQKIVVPQMTTLQVKVGAHAFLFTGPSSFIFGDEHTIGLISGMASFALMGGHEKLTIVVPGATIRPFRCSFTTEIDGQETKLSLRRGAIAIMRASEEPVNFHGPVTIKIDQSGSLSVKNSL